ncbi:hypothetical protein [Paenibacillus sp. TCA20]|uniref:hypothetical protein n=1 Tax=Paenibacillus sp. TCA20 TaxID=1499968 RepID=UPI00064C4E86|nr:hypothetical protein [Paenibacillus sp. TCA20]
MLVLLFISYSFGFLGFGSARLARKHIGLTHYLVTMRAQKDMYQVLSVKVATLFFWKVAQLNRHRPAGDHRNQHHRNQGVDNKDE